MVAIKVNHAQFTQLRLHLKWSYSPQGRNIIFTSSSLWDDSSKQNNEIFLKYFPVSYRISNKILRYRVFQINSFVKVRVEYSVTDMSQLERFDIDLNRVTSVNIPKTYSFQEEKIRS
jgi:hypothetical protein